MLKFSDLPGKVMLVGITYFDKNKKLRGRRQFYGEIISADVIGIKVKCKNGKEILIPPDLKAIKPAAKGKYGVFTTHEVVEDPDFISNWNIQIS